MKNLFKLVFLRVIAPLGSRGFGFTSPSTEENVMALLRQQEDGGILEWYTFFRGMCDPEWAVNALKRQLPAIRLTTVLRGWQTGCFFSSPSVEYVGGGGTINVGCPMATETVCVLDYRGSDCRFGIIVSRNELEVALRQEIKFSRLVVNDGRKIGMGPLVDPCGFGYGYKFEEEAGAVKVCPPTGEEVCLTSTP